MVQNEVILMGFSKTVCHNDQMVASWFQLPLWNSLWSELRINQLPEVSHIEFEVNLESTNYLESLILKHPPATASCSMSVYYKI